MTDAGNPYYMTRALRLARRGLGHTSPNPPVGAVAVRGGVIVAEGWHSSFGAPHAEGEVIRRGGERCRRADLYVTLEPCTHHGKTPPCVEAIWRAGFARVFYTIDDPNPKTGGRGRRCLEDRGIRVVKGLATAAARELLAPYLKLTRTGRPLVTAKWAMTADGRIATHRGDSRWISSAVTRRRTRRERGTYDAILIGRGTLADDPRLTCRTLGRANPLRVLLDSCLRLGPDSALVRTVKEAPLLVAAVEGAQGADAPAFATRRRRLEASGVEVRTYPRGPGGIDVSALLVSLGERGIAHLLVEGGGGVHGSFFDGGFVDRVQIILAPHLIGNSRAPGPVAGNGVERMRDAWTLREWRLHRLQGDLLLEAPLTAAGRGEWTVPKPGC